MTLRYPGASTAMASEHWVTDTDEKNPLPIRWGEGVPQNGEGEKNPCFIGVQSVVKAESKILFERIVQAGFAKEIQLAETLVFH
jgi:hypothetical protein